MSYGNKRFLDYFIGGKRDTTSDYFNNIDLMKADYYGNITTKYYESPDTSVGLAYSLKVGDHFLGFGSYDFNTFDSAGGMYNILFDDSLTISRKKVLYKSVWVAQFYKEPLLPIKY